MIGSTEAMEILGCSYVTLWSHVQKGLVKKYQTPTKRNRYDRQEIEDFAKLKK